MSWKVATLGPNRLFKDVGFTIFSQSDEDGIIQYLVNTIQIQNKTFIEFGVEDYEESNTRFLLLNDNWRGFVLDADRAHIRYVQRDSLYWQYDLQAKHAWITRDNINELLNQAGFGEDVGLLSIDIDGNDYWIWDAIQAVRPRIVIAEYNSLFGIRPIAVPYREKFDRMTEHYSSLYYGSSLGALNHLAAKKGYLLLGSNAWGHNAFFVRKDIAGEFKGVEVSKAYVDSNIRESRDKAGNLSYVRGIDRLKLIQDMPVVNVVTGEHGQLADLWEVP